MQAIPIASKRTEGPLTSNSAHLDVVPAPHGRAPTQCQRCGIPFGPSRCPNPACHEVHGERVGTLCGWCHETAQAHQTNNAIAG